MHFASHLTNHKATLVPNAKELHPPSEAADPVAQFGSEWLSELQERSVFALGRNRPSYVATVVGSETLDQAQKIQTASRLEGPRLTIALAPCPTGWDYDPAHSVDVARLAVKTGVWPLKEYRDGKPQWVESTRMTWASLRAAAAWVLLAIASLLLLM